ncbi:MAG: DUF3810 domain-containing protein, partial [Eubacteriales bacterium]
RAALAYITGWLPFSLGEIILYLLPLGTLAALIWCIILCMRGGKRVWRFLSAMLAIAAYVYILYSIGYVSGYTTSTLEVKLGLDRRAVSAQELYDTASILLDKTTGYLDYIEYDGNGSSVMPYTKDEMNEKLNDAYASAAKKYAFIQPLRSKVKYVWQSEAMTYTHLSGVYTLYTGEANINVNFPDYTLPYTTAHELSHQRGIAREDEANFMAFLVSIESGDSYILYSAYQNLFEYVASALYSADRDMYMELLARMDDRIRYEMIAYNDFYEKYRENKAADIANSINDSYLKQSGQSAGVKSYGRVVDLAVAYFRAGE